MPYWFWGQKVKGQSHGAWLFENGFRTITDSVINQWSWNFIHLLTMSQGCALLILRSKGQRSRSWRMVIWKWFPDDNWLCNQPMIMKLHTLTHHESRMRPYWFWGQKVKGQGHGAMVIWKWFPDDNWLCNQPMIMKLHTLTPHEICWGRWGTCIASAILFSMLLYVAPICCPSCYLKCKHCVRLLLTDNYCEKQYLQTRLWSGVCCPNQQLNIP